MSIPGNKPLRVDEIYDVGYFQYVKDKYTNFIISANDQGRRLDNIIKKFLPDIPVSVIYKFIRSGDIRLNTKKVKQDTRVEINDELNIYSNILIGKKESAEKTGPSIDKKRIVFENAHILIYNKPAGELVHGEKNSLDVKIKNYLGDKIEKSLSFSPGPLHRLDRNTQGLIAFSASLKGARDFSTLLQNREIKKVYLTVVSGEYKNREIWKDKLIRDKKNRISTEDEYGKDAETHFIPIISKNGVTLALMDIKSGRTHQIRVQSALHGKPLISDNKYGVTRNNELYFLASIYLSITGNNDIINREHFFINILEYTSTLKKFFTLEELKNAQNRIKGELDLK